MSLKTSHSEVSQIKPDGNLHVNETLHIIDNAYIVTSFSPLKFTDGCVHLRVLVTCPPIG